MSYPDTHLELQYFKLCNSLEAKIFIYVPYSYSHTSLTACVPAALSKSAGQYQTSVLTQDTHIGAMAVVNSKCTMNSSNVLQQPI